MEVVEWVEEEAEEGEDDVTRGILTSLNFIDFMEVIDSFFCKKVYIIISIYIYIYKFTTYAYTFTMFLIVKKEKHACK